MKAVVLSLVALSAWPAAAQAPPPRVSRSVDVSKEIVVVVNDNSADSIAVGAYYAQKRGIPAAQVCRLAIPSNGTVMEESCSRPDMRTHILEPLRTFLSSRPEVLYIVTTYGIPIRTWPELDDQVATTDMSAIDRDIELLNVSHNALGRVASAVLGADRHITTADHVYIVSRLDGPSASDAIALVDRALEGEAHGIAGTCFLDTGGHPSRPDLTNDWYDQALKGIASTWTQYGVVHEHDDEQAFQDLTLRAGQAHYWGFYGPAQITITDPNFRFNPGAVGVLSNSMPARGVRWGDWWVSWAIRAGVTCTAGCGEEPYEDALVRGDIFHDRFLHGYTFGEAMEMANPYTSWHMIFIGDPLYAPYAANVMATQPTPAPSPTPGGGSPGSGDGGGGAGGGGCAASVAGLGLLALLPLAALRR